MVLGGRRRAAAGAAKNTIIFNFSSFLNGENPYFCNPFWGLYRPFYKGETNIILLSSVG